MGVLENEHTMGTGLFLVCSGAHILSASESLLQLQSLSDAFWEGQ